MRKLIIKYFVGSKLTKSNPQLIVSEILFYVLLTCFIQGHFITGGALAFLAFGLFFWGLTSTQYHSSRHRASYILFPLIVLAGNISLLCNQIWIYGITAIFLLAYLGPELYLYFNRLKWEELSKEQKWQLGSEVWAWRTLTPEQKKEWNNINKMMKP